MRKECFYYVLIRAQYGSYVAEFITVFAVVAGQLVIVVRLLEETFPHLVLILVGFAVLLHSILVEALTDLIVRVFVFLLDD